MKEDVRDSLGNQISPLRALQEAPNRAESLSLLKLGHGFQLQFKSHFAAGTFPDQNGKNSLDNTSKLHSCVGLKTTVHEDFQDGYIWPSPKRWYLGSQRQEILPLQQLFLPAGLHGHFSQLRKRGKAWFPHCSLTFLQDKVV